MAYQGPIVLPMLLIAGGLVLLLANLGYLELDVPDLIRRFWPLLLVAIGLEIIIGATRARRSGSVAAVPETLSYELGGAEAAQVRLVFGAGHLTVGAGAPGNLLDGTFEGGVRARRGGAGTLELRSDPDVAWGGAWRGRPARWDVRITPDVPLDLRVETGASRAELDLSALRLRQLVLRVGASETVVRLPVPQGHVRIEADVGAASANFHLPPGAAARIHSTMGLGSSDVDEVRFPRQGRAHVTPGFDAAADRIELDIRGGVGSISVH